MALVINDRVKETSTTSGTGDITLAGVTSGQGNVLLIVALELVTLLIIVFLNKVLIYLK